MGRLLEIASGIRKTVIPVAGTLDAPCQKPAAPPVRRRAIPVRVARCPGCSKPIGDVTTQWGGRAGLHQVPRDSDGQSGRIRADSGSALSSGSGNFTKVQCLPGVTWWVTALDCVSSGCRFRSVELQRHNTFGGSDLWRLWVIIPSTIDATKRVVYPERLKNV